MLNTLNIYANGMRIFILLLVYNLCSKCFQRDLLGQYCNKKKKKKKTEVCFSFVQSLESLDDASDAEFSKYSRYFIGRNLLWLQVRVVYNGSYSGPSAHEGIG